MLVLPDKVMAITQKATRGTSPVVEYGALGVGSEIFCRVNQSSFTYAEPSGSGNDERWDDTYKERYTIIMKPNALNNTLLSAVPTQQGAATDTLVALVPVPNERSPFSSGTIGVAVQRVQVYPTHISIVAEAVDARASKPFADALSTLSGRKYVGFDDVFNPVIPPILPSWDESVWIWDSARTFFSFNYLAEEYDWDFSAIPQTDAQQRNNFQNDFREVSDWWFEVQPNSEGLLQFEVLDIGRQAPNYYHYIMFQDSRNPDFSQTVWWDDLSVIPATPLSGLPDDGFTLTFPDGTTTFHCGEGDIYIINVGSEYRGNNNFINIIREASVRRFDERVFINYEDAAGVRVGQRRAGLGARRAVPPTRLDLALNPQFVLTVEPNTVVNPPSPVTTREEKVYFYQSVHAPDLVQPTWTANGVALSGWQVANDNLTITKPDGNEMVAKVWSAEPSNYYTSNRFFMTIARAGA